MARSASSLLLTRPAAQSERFAAELRTAWGGTLEIVISPILDIVPVSGAADVSDAGTVLFTSENAVTHAPRRPELPAICVGSRTAESARAAGFAAEAAGGDVDALVAHVAATNPVPPLVHLRGRHTTGDLAARLTALGHPARDAVVYDQLPAPLSAAARSLLSGRHRVILPLFSPRSAKLLRAAAGPIVAPHVAVAISPAVAQAWSADETVIAARPDAAAMIASILETLRQDSGC